MSDQTFGREARRAWDEMHRDQPREPIRPSEDAIVGLLQDLGDQCTGAAIELGNNELFFTEDNINEWRALHAELDRLYDKVAYMIERSKEPEPTPPEYSERPIYGVTNGRGRIIA